MSTWAYQSDNKQRRFLIVEDEPDLAQLIALYLQDLNGQITVSASGDEGLQLATQQHWDAVLLDIRLPGVDGLEICRQMRSEGLAVPVLMLTARSSELDRVLGLEMGADDYLVKPFSTLELQARVKALLRRSENQPSVPGENPELSVGDFLLHQERRTAQLCGCALELTAKEFDLLWFFAQNPGTVFRRTDLLEQVWGYLHQGYEHTVNSHINRLRGKVERHPARPRYIQTVWGVGYRFQGSQ